MRGWIKDGLYFIETCYTCKVEFGLPARVYQTLTEMAEKGTFYCPYGHSQHYVSGESEAEKLRRERDQLKQRVAEWQDQANLEAERHKETSKILATTRGMLTKTRKRVAGGLCPCCNRHFTALERHMHTKHPDYKQEEV